MTAAQAVKVTLLNIVTDKSENTVSDAYQKLINDRELNDDEELNDEESDDDEELNDSEELNDNEELDDEEAGDDEELNNDKELNDDNKDLYDVSDKEKEWQKCHNIEQTLPDPQDSLQQSNLCCSKCQIEENLKDWLSEALFSLSETLASG